MVSQRTTEAKRLALEPPQAAQKPFFAARQRFVCYGGARGGGKSWCVRQKAILMAFRWAGIKILIMRKTLEDLRDNFIRPMTATLNGFAQYRYQERTFLFPNGSLVIFGYCARESDIQHYQGQEYDVIFIDEATQFTEDMFKLLLPSVRGVNAFPKRVYLTCNPGDVGHAWVKRLFIDRDFREGEDPDDYVMFRAKVTDNEILMRSDPEYVKMLDALPEKKRAAWRDGDWDVFAGQYFTEWDRDAHVCEAFAPPAWWRWYVTMDYGLDMLAALLIGVDATGEAYVVGEVYEGRDLGDGHDGLIVSEAAKRVKELADGRTVTAFLAPPDLWNRRQETGKSVADIFAEHGVYLTKTSNDRIDGWMAVKEWLKPRMCEDGVERPRLRFFPNCRNIIRTLPLLQYDDRRASDVKNEPHEITHAPDALRGFCVYWTGSGVEPAPATRVKLTEKLGGKIPKRRV